jgi:hypothetical protein
LRGLEVGRLLQALQAQLLGERVERLVGGSSGGGAASLRLLVSGLLDAACLL